MFSWITALLSALACFLLASAWLWLVKRRRKEMSLGLQALAGMHWRDFSELVKRALCERRRLHELRRDVQDTLEPRSDFLLGGSDGHWLVSCKHGLAYRIGTAAVNELGAAARLSGARGGILITEGRVDGEGQSVADKQAVEVLDGKRLWPLLSPYLPGDIESGVRASARHEALRRTAIAGLASCTVGLLVGFGLQAAQVPSPFDGTNPAAVATMPAVQAGDKAPDAGSSALADEAVASAPEAQIVAPMQERLDPDEDTLRSYQQELSRALGRIEGVSSAVWQTRQTLVVSRTADIDAVWPQICTEVMRHPSLRNVRVQLDARPGVQEPVRWRQCATL